jgi:hypothetical protein
VLVTAVTWAPSDLAIWTANVPTPSPGAVDQHPLPRLDLPFVAQALPGGTARDGDRRGLLERQVTGLRRQAVCEGRRVLGEGSDPHAEDLISRRLSRRAHRISLSGQEVPLSFRR